VAAVELDNNSLIDDMVSTSTSFGAFLHELGHILKLNHLPTGSSECDQSPAPVMCGAGPLGTESLSQTSRTLLMSMFSNDRNLCAYFAPPDYSNCSVCQPIPSVKRLDQDPDEITVIGCTGQEVEIEFEICNDCITDKDISPQLQWVSGEFILVDIPPSTNGLNLTPSSSSQLNSNSPVSFVEDQCKKSIVKLTLLDGSNPDITGRLIYSTPAVSISTNIQVPAAKPKDVIALGETKTITQLRDELLILDPLGACNGIPQSLGIDGTLIIVVRPPIIQTKIYEG